MRQHTLTMAMTLLLVGPSAAWAELSPQPVAPQETLQSKTPEDPLSALMEQARQAFSLGDYPRAIQLYTKVLEAPDGRHAQDAMEMLGVSRERNGQLAQAKSIYEKYLSQYTSGEQVERVKQRLAGLTTLDWQPKDKLPEQATAKAAADNWRVYGGFSQTVNHYSDQLSGGGTSTTTRQGNLLTALDLNLRGRTERLDIKGRINGSLSNDIVNNAPDQTYLNFAYLDLATHGGLSTRLGRQSQYDSGIFGRFDGIGLRLRLNPQYTVKLASGYPVERTRLSAIDTNRQFTSASMDYTPSASAWQFNGYLIEQRADGLLDRRAVGMESRYFKDSANLTSLLDYDIHFNQLNIFMLQGNLPLSNKTFINFAADYRAAPLIATRNALIGQTTDSLSALRDTYTDQEIRNLARDRTSASEVIMLGLSHQLSSDYRLDSDLTVSRMGATPASGGVTATPGTGTEYFLTGRLTINNLFRPKDVGFVGLRLGKLANADTLSLNLNSRQLTASGWRFNPGIRSDYRRYTDQDTRQWQLAPNLRLDYQWGQRYFFETELGYEWTRIDTWFGQQTDQATYLRLGYRIDF